MEGMLQTVREEKVKVISSSDECCLFSLEMLEQQHLAGDLWRELYVAA